MCSPLSVKYGAIEMTAIIISSIIIVTYVCECAQEHGLAILPEMFLIGFKKQNVDIDVFDVDFFHCLQF